MSTLHAIILALVQGAFELFPVSSLGHAVLLPALLKWPERPADPSFLAFVVVLHLGTATALLVFFWRDWLRIVSAVLVSIRDRRLTNDIDEHLGWLIVVGSIPAGVLGLLLKKPLNDLFGHPTLAATCLLLNGLVLLGGERLRQRVLAGRREVRADLAELDFKAAFGIGAAQALALIPGFSRSGTSMVGGLLAGLHHIDAARLSFMMATPLILAAGILEVPELFKSDSTISAGLAGMGFVISGVTAFFTVKFLMRFFQTESLNPMGYYCLAFGGLALVILGIRG